MTKILGIVALAGVAASAQADFTVTGAGPYNSDGAAGAGTNGIFSFIAGESGNFNRVRITGTATSGGVGSYKSELRYRINADGAATRDSSAVASGSTWSGGIAVDNTQSFARFTFTSGSSYNVNFWEGYNDSGIDATWSNVSFTFYRVQPPSCTNLGYIDRGSFTLDTLGSALASSNDTEIGLYDANGALIATNDDINSGAGNYLSSIAPGSLADGTYYVAVSGYNSTFDADWGVSSSSAYTGTTTLNISNGTSTVSRSDALGAGGINWYCFTVPAPSSIALAGVAGLVAIRRRR